MHPQLDSASLQAFVQVAESGSFSIAAGKLFLTQSAISKRIAHLEEQVDCRLFDRIGRQISLTEAAAPCCPRRDRFCTPWRMPPARCKTSPPR